MHVTMNINKRNNPFHKASDTRWLFLSYSNRRYRHSSDCITT